MKIQCIAQKLSCDEKVLEYTCNHPILHVHTHEQIKASPKKGLMLLMSLVGEAELTFPEEVVLLSTLVDEQIQSGNGTVTEGFSKVKLINLQEYKGIHV